MKKIFTIAIMTLAVNAFAQIPTNGLIGHYPFNSNANDQSGNGNNGTVNGATLTADRFGNINSAYDFLNLSDMISISSITQTNVTQYSVAGWFRKTTSSINNEGSIFCGSDPLLVNGLRFHIGSDNQAAWGVENQGSSVWSYSQNQNYADGNWHFFAIIFDANIGIVDSTELKIYIDNIEIPKIQGLYGTQSNVTAPINNQNLPTIIGNVPGADDNFKGTLDDIRIYNRVLNTTEINSIYNEGVCYQLITVTDTLLINTTITSYNPVTYQNTIKIWPNPTNDHITIDNGNIANLTGYQLKITNSLSQQVFQSNITQQQFYVDLTTWTGNGIYFVHIIDGQGNTIDIKKIVLQ